MRVYISGPMSDYPDYNYEAFNEAERLLKETGFVPLNPARNPQGLEYNHYMDISMAMIRASEAVFCLDGYENSKGALAEIAYAKSLGLQIIIEKETLG